MKRIYDFSRNPAERDDTIADLRALKGSGCNTDAAMATIDEIRGVEGIKLEDHVLVTDSGPVTLAPPL